MRKSIQLFHLFSKCDLLGKNLTKSVLCFSRTAVSHNIQQLKNPPRQNPAIMKIDSPKFHASLTDEVRVLEKLFTDNKYELRIAGGAVRDLLLNIQPTDLDFATTALPLEMQAMFLKHEIRMFNNNGIKHGTISIRINDKANFEITTLRIDKVTDGRRAEVEFTKDWMLDALRRDLTINSMFLGLDGTVYDYFNGYKDLMARRIVFVGDAATRIQEDYLRILRYFRFFGRISLNPDSHDEETLEIIKKYGHGLEMISGERIWMELKKILEGNFAVQLIEKMISLELGQYIGFPSTYNLTELKNVWTTLQNNNLKVNGVTLLSALFFTVEDFHQFMARVRLPNFERDLVIFLISHRKGVNHPKPIRPYQILFLKESGRYREYTFELLKYRGDVELLKELEQWEVPRFPVNGKQIVDRGVPAGKSVGIVMEQLKEIWAESDFTMSTEEILNKIPSPEELKKMSKKSPNRSKKIKTN